MSLTEECPGFLSQPRIVASSTGLLAAAAISSASSPASVVPTAVETVLIAFRLGLQIDDVADRLSIRSHGDDVWAIHFPGTEEGEARQIIEEFNESRVITSTS